MAEELYFISFSKRSQTNKNKINKKDHSIDIRDNRNLFYFILFSEIYSINQPTEHNFGDYLVRDEERKEEAQMISFIHIAFLHGNPLFTL